MNPKEEKQFEGNVDQLIDYAENIKVSLQVFISKIENQGSCLEWTQVLDSFSSICGQINTLMRYTRRNKIPFIGNRVVLPLLVSPDRDEDLVKLTEGRVQIVNHEMVPDYLRTKPDPEIEEQERMLQIKSNTITPDAAVKQINAMTKLTNNLEGIITSIKQSSAVDDKKPSYINTETFDLIAAVSCGIGIRHGTGPMRGQMQDVSYLQKPMQGGPSLGQKNVKAPELKINIINKPG